MPLSIVSITLNIRNNRNYPQRINVLGSPVNPLDTANAATEYRWDITSYVPTPSDTLTLEYKPVGAASFAIYTCQLSNANPEALIAALNGLGIGYFNYYNELGQDYVSTNNDNYEFGNLTIDSNIPTTTTTSTTTTAAPTTSTTTTTTTAAPTTSTTTTTTTAAPTTSTTTTTTTAAPTTSTTTTTTAAPTTSTTTTTTAAPTTSTTTTTTTAAPTTSTTTTTTAAPTTSTTTTTTAAPTTSTTTTTTTAAPTTSTTTTTTAAPTTSTTTTTTAAPTTSTTTTTTTAATTSTTTTTTTILTSSLYIQSRYTVNSDFLYVFYRVNGGGWNNLVTSGGIAPPTSYTSLAPFWIPSGITIGDTIDIAITRYTSDANLQFGAGFTSSPSSGDWTSYCGKATPYSFVFNDTDVYINVDSVNGSDVYVNCPTTTTTTTTTTTSSTTTTTTAPPPPTTSTTTTTTTVANTFSVQNNSATPIDVSISFDGVTIIASQTCAGNSVTTLIPNPQSYVPNVTTLIELSYSNGYTPATADLTFNLTNHAPDSYGNPITWNSIDTTGVTTDFEFTLNT